jgi:hypothetical protein
MEKITKDEYKIVVEHLTNLIDWEEVYNSSPKVSKKNFTKDHIIDHIKKMISGYPHFDTSVPGRIESGTGVFSVHYGFLNNYVHFFTNTNSSKYAYDGWFLTEDELMKAVDYHKSNNHHIVIFDYKQYLRTYKINKIYGKF